jgi:L-ascorbate metabolism protein UlaG (beta-lactamase superfamily)
MSWTRRSLRFFLAGMLLLVGSAVAQPASAEAEAQGDVTIEWLGWNAWRFTSPGGRVILANPFLANPDSPVSVDDITRADLILVTNGHGDEVGQAIQIAENTGARIIPGAFELGTWFMDRGVPAAQVLRTGGPGNRVQADGINVRLVNGAHGSGLTPSENVFYGGPASAFVVTFENGWTLFFGGSTAATYDHLLAAQMYQPHAAILHLGGAAEPMDFAMQTKLLQTDNPNLATVFPGHHRVIQQGTTIAEAQTAVNSMGLGLTITEPVIGQVYRFGR